MLNTFQKFKKVQISPILTILTILTSVTIVTSVVFAGIATTKHNMSTTGGPTYYATSETQICVFCHTPHSASKAVDGAPLWNHSISNANYSVRDSSIIQAWRVTNAQQPDGSSKLCLGCHDGTVALGLLVNVPGSGMGGTVTGLESPMSCGPSDYSCLGTNFTPTADLKHLNAFGDGDHLISMEYNAALATAVQAKCNIDLTYAIINPADILSTDPVKLYNTKHRYPGPDDLSYVKGVQCRTCHDPHNNADKFLVKGTSANWDPLCETCHYTCP